MQYLPILLLLIGLGFGLVDAQAEDNDLWYVGKELKKGDYISYKLCPWDHNNCQDFQMDIWVDGEMSLGSESRWTAQVLVTYENLIEYLFVKSSELQPNEFVNGVTEIISPEHKPLKYAKTIPVRRYVSFK